MHRIVVLTFFVILGLIVGCSSNKGTNVAKNSPVLDVAPTAAPIPSAEPTMAAGPINDNPPVAFSAPTPAPVQQVAFATPAPTASKASAKTYTVRKGDTLFSIAKSQLGSGREWQKIAAANPGLTPQKLKAGQQIAMP
jgi:nucleoid-associated protein YgaU